MWLITEIPLLWDTLYMILQLITTNQLNLVRFWCFSQNFISSISIQLDLDPKSLTSEEVQHDYSFNQILNKFR